MAWPPTEARSVTSSTMMIVQLIDAAAATGTASRRAMPCERFHRVSHKIMYAMAKPTPAHSTTLEAALNTPWLAASAGHHAAAGKPNHRGVDTAIRTNSPATE